MKNLKITTSEIARICGVSQGTVDRALNNRSDIKAETKQKILEVARQYGYRNINVYPDCITEQVGVVVFDLKNEYFSDLVTEIEFILREKGYAATVMMTHYNQQYEIECIRNLYNMGVKGVVLCAINNGKEFENYLKLFDMPIVAVGNKIDGIPYIGIDDFTAMKEMTQNALKENPENIIYFSPALRYNDAYAQILRYKGFLNAIGNNKHTVVTDIKNIREDYDEKTTVICSTDYYAMKVHFKAKNAKVLGFDNISAIDKYKLPIDTVGYSVTEVARRVIEAIEENKKDDVIIKHTIVKHNNQGL